jgi:histidinol phosphatase-like PHP family hydrolase
MTMRSTSSDWQPRDCHAHTTWSDGELAAGALIAAVRARGVRPSISDHVTRDGSHALTSVEAVSEYLDALHALDDPDLAIAGEFCWHDGLWRELPPAVVRRFTHRLGSLHAIELPDGTLLNMFHGDLPPGLTTDAYMDLHVAAVERFAAEMPVDILAHPTLLPVPLRAVPLEDLWTEARETRAVHALARAGIAFEISNRYRAHERFVRRAFEAGVRLSLGSDGHTLRALGDVAWPLAVARGVGARDEELYDPRRHGSRTGSHPERVGRAGVTPAHAGQPAAS